MINELAVENRLNGLSNEAQTLLLNLVVIFGDRRRKRCCQRSLNSSIELRKGFEELFIERFSIKIIITGVNIWATKKNQELDFIPISRYIFIKILVNCLGISLNPYNTELDPKNVGAVLKDRYLKALDIWMADKTNAKRLEENKVTVYILGEELRRIDNIPVSIKEKKDSLYLRGILKNSKYVNLYFHLLLATKDGRLSKNRVEETLRQLNGLSETSIIYILSYMEKSSKAGIGIVGKTDKFIFEEIFNLFKNIEEQFSSHTLLLALNTFIKRKGEDTNNIGGIKLRKFIQFLKSSIDGSYQNIDRKLTSRCKLTSRQKETIRIKDILEVLPNDKLLILINLLFQSRIIREFSEVEASEYYDLLIDITKEQNMGYSTVCEVVMQLANEKDISHEGKIYISTIKARIRLLKYAKEGDLKRSKYWRGKTLIQ